jgi:hypothetical protein
MAKSDRLARETRKAAGLLRLKLKKSRAMTLLSEVVKQAEMRARKPRR